MSEEVSLKEKYRLARCCSPAPPAAIVGYFSHDDIIKVHRENCANLPKADAERFVRLEWRDILKETPAAPPAGYDTLERDDFLILQHHAEYGVDYSLKVAAVLRLPEQEVFDRHRRLRDMGLLKRVEPVMIQYRKGVVANKWIKHRNHTYYQLTDEGQQCLSHYLDNA
jgi:hypothetical protein